MFVLGSKTGESCWKAALLLIVYLSAATVVLAQSDVAAVHILPRIAKRSPSARQATFRRDVDLVLVNVTVLDHANRTVTGLAPSDFSILEDKQPQSIKYFSSDDQPLSLAIVLDASASMAPRMEQARKAVLELVQTANPLDDISVVVVGDTPRIELAFDDSLDTLPARLETIQAHGRTALWDAMLLSLDELRQAHYQRRAMVVISDGGDNHSLYTESELQSAMEEADVQVYAVGLFDRFPVRNEERRGPRDLDELTSTGGGRLLVANDGDDLRRAVRQINQELRNEYVIGYLPSEAGRSGKWRRIKVSIRAPERREKLRLYAKKGYYETAE